MGQRLSEDSNADKEIDVAELQEWYKKFVVECPSGTLFMHEFKGFFGVSDNQAAASYIENMFRAFDKNGVSWCSPLPRNYILESNMQNKHSTNHPSIYPSSEPLNTHLYPSSEPNKST